MNLNAYFYFRDPQCKKVLQALHTITTAFYKVQEKNIDIQHLRKFRMCQSKNQLKKNPNKMFQKRYCIARWHENSRGSR